MTQLLSDNKVSSMHLVTKIAYLYNLGNEYVDLTGGWGRNNPLYGTVTKNADHIYLKGTSNGGGVCACTIDEIDLSEYSKLYVDIAFNIATTSATISGFGIGKVSLSGVTNHYATDQSNAYAYSTLSIASYERQIMSLDISEVSVGFPFIGLTSRAATPQNEAFLYRMWLEK